MDPTNLSSLLFSDETDSSLHLTTSSWLGPVALATVSTTSVTHKNHGHHHNQAMMGLVVTRDVSPGECLFIMNPTASADVDTVKEYWQAEQSSTRSSSLQDTAEQVLLQVMKQCLDESMEIDNTTKRRSRSRNAESFLMLVGHDGTRIMAEAIRQGDAIQILLGSNDDDDDDDDDDASEEDDPISTFTPNDIVPEETLLDIIRHNAFGPDFHNYSVMEDTWLTQDSNSNGQRSRTAPYHRILGMYPLAAMINHSCASNAVRVFHGETMMVHATNSIAKGEEIVWSYIPPIEPFPSRQSQLKEMHDFECQCVRCTEESRLYADVVGLEQQLNPISSFQPRSESRMAREQQEAVVDHVDKLEEVLADPRIPNEARRLLRVCYLKLYISYFNAVLSIIDNIDDKKRKRVLTLASQLHFSLLTCHKGSTEHLSILHLCYELVSLLYSRDEPNKVRFWVEQLKQAHMVRYGSLGNDLESVREVMKHSRGILRAQHGLQKARYKFL